MRSVAIGKALAFVGCVFALGAQAQAAEYQRSDWSLYDYEPHVRRVRPSSPKHQYPFGRLSQDYTPYGMPGVPDCVYFDDVRCHPARRRRAD